MPREDDPSPIRVDQIAAAGEMLSRAFSAYPPMRHFLPSDEVWAAAAPFLFQAPLRFGMTCGRTEVRSETLEGAAVWVRGRLCPLSFWRALRAKRLAMRVRPRRGSSRATVDRTPLAIQNGLADLSD
jgi:hypothetical protein